MGWGRFELTPAEGVGWFQRQGSYTSMLYGSMLTTVPNDVWVFSRVKSFFKDQMKRFFKEHYSWCLMILCHFVRKDKTVNAMQAEGAFSILNMHVYLSKQSSNCKTTIFNPICVHLITGQPRQYHIWGKIVLLFALEYETLQTTQLSSNLLKVDWSCVLWSHSHCNQPEAVIRFMAVIRKTSASSTIILTVAITNHKVKRQYYWC